MQPMARGIQRSVTMIEAMVQALQYEFMQNAIVASLLVSLACGLIGSFIVINRMVFISGGVAHAAYGGIGLGYYFAFNPLWGALHLW